MNPPSVIVTCIGCGDLSRFRLTPYQPQHGLVREIIAKHETHNRCRGPCQVLTSGQEVVSWWDVDLEHVANTRTDKARRVVKPHKVIEQDHGESVADRVAEVVAA